eukprot:9857450-Alexandrium_andersonii.AAC.1
MPRALGRRASSSSGSWGERPPKGGLLGPLGKGRPPLMYRCGPLGGPNSWGCSVSKMQPKAASSLCLRDR